MSLFGILKTDDAWTGPDKTKHVVLCAGGALIVGLTFGIVPAIVAGVAVGLAKEVVYDAYLKRGTPSLQDFVASCLGVGLGTLAAHILRATS